MTIYARVLLFTNCEWLMGLPTESGHRRVQPQRLLNYRLEIRQRLHGGWVVRRAYLLVQLALMFRMCGQQENSKGDGGAGGVMTLQNNMFESIRYTIPYKRIYRSTSNMNVSTSS